MSRPIALVIRRYTNVRFTKGIDLDSGVKVTTEQSYFVQDASQGPPMERETSPQVKIFGCRHATVGHPQQLY